MADHIVKMTVPVEITIHSTLSWHGKKDKNGNMIDELRYGGSATLYGMRVGSLMNVFKTEKAAVTALKKEIKRNLAG